MVPGNGYFQSSLLAGGSEAPPPLPSRQPSGQKQHSPPTSERPVLVVEDSPAAREVVSRILRRAGYRVVSAANGQEALEVLDQSKPGLVLLDVMMPEMDGMTLLGLMRQKPELRDTPVILLTALSDEGRMNRARELGVREYLVKTRFSYEELLEQVERHIRH